jgi:hypothetical protein
MKLKKLSNYALKLYLQSQPNPKQLIGLDLGSNYTGCSISCYNLKKAYVFLFIINCYLFYKYLKTFKINFSKNSEDPNLYYNRVEK